MDLCPRNASFVQCGWVVLQPGTERSRSHRRQTLSAALSTRKSKCMICVIDNIGPVKQKNSVKL